MSRPEFVIEVPPAMALPDVESRMLLKAALRRLGAGQRAVLALRFWQDLSVQATAQMLSCSVGNVTSPTNRALHTPACLACGRGQTGMIRSLGVRRWAVAVCVAGAALSVDAGPAVAGGIAAAPGPATPTPSVVTLPPSRIPVGVLPSHPGTPAHTLRFSPVPGRYSVGAPHGRDTLMVFLAVAVLLLAAGVGFAVRVWLSRG